VVALVVVASAGAAGCGRGDFEDRTAVVELGGGRETYEVDACGLDEQTIFLVARSPGGAVVQAVVGLEDDDATGILASTGLTIDLDPDSADTRVAAFGEEAWDRRGRSGTPPGTIASARLRGSRIQLSGEVVDVDALDRTVAGRDPQPFSVDARCDLQDDGDD
jgi:hypothetical protein